uniref:Zinc fingers and homeoboxes protein 1 n=1 Tax=Neogobius melanostomus TaxID=47308 RepID=A0A8C6SI56_9GOBI
QPSVEQQCDTPDEGSADPTNITAISLSKTPIMRMKTKSEPKRIAVSLKSTDEATEGFGGGSEGDVGGEQEPIEAPLGPMTVLSAFQAQQSTGSTAVQPQLLIPLSSIPSYSAAMDTNPLLGSTYKKFPYPSMAEISSLAAQTQFTEEQIKVWFSAQRLKHGVSWTPEEVEEARRKQFNGTVHTVPQTITVIPAHQLSAAANGLQSILQTCQIVGQSGLVFTQVGPSGNLPVTSPITLTVAGLPSQSQSSSRVSTQSSSSNSELKRATTVQPPSLSPQVALYILFTNSALSADTFGMRPKKSKEQLAELKASYLKNHFVTDAEIARLMKLTNLTKGEIKKWFSDTRYNQRNSKNSHIIMVQDGTRGGSSANATIVIDSSDETPTSPNPPRTPPVKEKETRTKTWNPFPDFTLQKFKEKTPEQLVVLEESFEKSSTPGDEELSRLRAETKLTRREIDAWFTERRKVPSATSPDSDGSKLETEEGVETAGSTKENQTPPGGQSKELPSTSCSSKDMKDKGKKSPEQLHMLKCAFVRNQWPTAEEYDQLAEESGLSRSYIVSWFGDSRYSWKNGNLNNVLKDYYLKYRFLNEQDLDELVTKTNMSYEQVKRVQLYYQVPGEDAHGPGGEQSGLGMGEDDDDDEDEEDGEDSDDSEVWEPSRSVRKSLSVSED